MPFRLDKAYILVPVIAALILSACGTSTGVPPATQAVTPGERTPRPSATAAKTATATVQHTPTIQPHLEVTQSELAGIAINFWHPWQGDLAARTEEAVEEFNRTNEWGIDVQAQPLYGTGALFDAVVAVGEDAADQGNRPDVIAAPSDTFPVLEERGFGPVDLSGYIAHPEWGLSEGEVAAFHPAFWEQDQRDGQQLGIPALRSATVLFYNQTWAEELGFSSTPETQAQLAQQACAAAVENNQHSQVELHGTGGYLVDTSALTAMSWLGAFGAQPEPEQAGRPYRFESEEGQEALEYLRDMFDSGCAWLGRNPEPYDYFSRRMALFYAGSLPEVYVQQQVMERQGSNDRWVLLPFPGKDGDPVVYAGGYSYAVLPSQPDRQMAAWLFIRWMSRPVIQARLAEALPSLPVTDAVVTELQDYQAHFPWASIFPLLDAVQPIPNDAGWRTARRVLEDAFRQVFYLPADQVETVLPLVDEMLQELQEEISQQAP